MKLISLRIKNYSLIILALIFSNSLYASNDKLQIGLDSIRSISNTFYRIKNNYVEEIDSQYLVNGCIAGMVTAADPESAFLDVSKFDELKNGNRFVSGGVGLKLSIKNGYPVVVTPIEGTPSYQSGIKSGDILLQIDKNDMHGKNLDYAVSLLKGDPDSSVHIRVARKDLYETLTFNIKREKIRIKGVTKKLLANNIGYIRISAFRNNTAKKVKSQLKILLREAGGELKGLIMDLRNNPGGLVNEAIDVADTFLTKGIIAYTKTRTSGAELKFRAKSEQYLSNTPMVILINEGSAGSSEIVTGALKDHHRATLVGRNTYGSSSIQTIIPLGNGSALKLTTARWITPSGNFIHGNGIKPDLIVNEAPNIEDDYQLKRALQVFDQ